MCIKKEAAYHEASHAVVANLSIFHSLVDQIDLKNYGSGETFISLSKRKLIAKGKSADSSNQHDKEVIIDMVVILCAGIVGEEIASEKHEAIIPDSTCSEPDKEFALELLQEAGLDDNLNIYNKSARKILVDEWDNVESLANALFQENSMLAIDVLDMLNET